MIERALCLTVELANSGLAPLLVAAAMACVDALRRPASGRALRAGRHRAK